MTTLEQYASLGAAVRGSMNATTKSAASSMYKTQKEKGKPDYLEKFLRKTILRECAETGLLNCDILSRFHSDFGPVCEADSASLVGPDKRTSTFSASLQLNDKISKSHLVTTKSAF